MDLYFNFFQKFRTHACVKPVGKKIVFKPERDVEIKREIKVENSHRNRPNESQINRVATTDTPPNSWAQEKKILIDKMVAMKSENQAMAKNLHENHAELAALRASKQLIEKQLEEKDMEHSLRIRELSKLTEKESTSQKTITDLKRKNQLLMSQTKQLHAGLNQTRDKKSDSYSEDEEDVYEVERLLDDKIVTNTHRCFLVRWKGYDASHDSWERESNLTCPKILKKYKQSKNRCA